VNGSLFFFICACAGFTLAAVFAYIAESLKLRLHVQQARVISALRGLRDTDEGRCEWCASTDPDACEKCPAGDMMAVGRARQAAYSLLKEMEEQET